MLNSNAARLALKIRRLERTVSKRKGGAYLQLIPGLLATGLLAWLSIWFSEFVGITLLGFDKSPISEVMMAILLGMVIGNVVRLPEWLKPGLKFSVKRMLHLGIILLGIRLSITDVFELGALGVPVVVLCIASALFITTRLNNWLKLPQRVGALIAVGTSICGVTAVVATAPAIDAEDEEVAYAVAVITVFGLVAMLAYPYAAHLLFAGDPVKVGLFLGTAVHETSQVTGAGLVYADVFSSPKALDVATITKLVRNVFLAVVVPFMALYYTRRAAKQGESAQNKVSFTKLFPKFILGFLALAVLRSLGDAGLSAGGQAFGLLGPNAWHAATDFLKHWAVNFMVIALAGVGLSTSFRMLKGLGIKPFAVGLGAALIVGAVSLTAISLLGTFVAF